MINRYASLKQGLVGCWCPSVSGSFGFRLPDLSGYGNAGTLTNMDPGTDWVPSGGKLALDFDGSNDYVSLSDPSYVDFGSGNFAISIWVKPTTVSTRQVLIGKDSDASGGRQFGLIIKNGSNNGTLDGYWYQSDTVGRFGSTSGNVISTSWSHVVFQKIDSTNIEIWINGVSMSVTLSGSATSMQSGVAELCIARRSYAGFNDFFQGQIDDIRIYNRALTPSELRLFYTGGRGVGLIPERIKHRRKTTAAATNRRRRLICGANC